MKTTINNLKGYSPLEKLTYNTDKNGVISFKEWGWNFKIEKTSTFDIELRSGTTYYQSFKLYMNDQVCEVWCDFQDKHLDSMTASKEGELPNDEQLVRTAWSWISNHV